MFINHSFECYIMNFNPKFVLNMLIRFILAFSLVSWYLYQKYPENFLRNSFLITLFVFLIYGPLINYLSKKTMTQQTEYEKKIEENKKKGIKPGILDELTWKSVLIVILLGTAIAGGSIFLLALILYLFL